MRPSTGVRIHITGVVQGVGFRPFVYGLAHRLSLTGWVRNTSAGVDIEVDGPQDALETFLQTLKEQAPALARIDQFQAIARDPDGFTSFEIIPSRGIAEAFQPISPDLSTCPDCLKELWDPADRRYRYPFINCTNCGPRFTILADIPYDRPNTTMSGFGLCPDCAREYQDPLDRRFHAQPVACPDCGPHIWLELPDSSQTPAQVRDQPTWQADSAVREARHLLASGKILAIKGLGGFHLACDAFNHASVAELRRRKLRIDKPFALMMPDLETVAAHSYLNAGEQSLLLSHPRPIVLLTRRPDSPIAREVAPGQDTLGVMLPYTPLHFLLMEPAQGFPPALVMTSGNLSEEPLATDNREARIRLNRLADAFLLHNRDIHTRCDDSVVRIFDQSVYPLRRARGFAPLPIRLGREMPTLFAAGAELKNTFCLTRGRYAFLSHHIGDLENYETLCAYEDTIGHYERLFRVRPEALAYDLHPDYLSTRYTLARAEREGLPAVGVQHHHAHIAACMAEHEFPAGQPVIGVSFDGTGYGEDGAIWGGEFLLADYHTYERVYHLAYVRLPGGEAAIWEPWRQGLAWLHRAGLGWEQDLPPVSAGPPEAGGVLLRQLEYGLNAPFTSSMGRLFDAVASILGIRQRVSYEAQAAMELEALLDPHETGAYPFTFAGEVADPTPTIRALVADMRAGVPLGSIAARFHNTVADMVLEACLSLRVRSGVNAVALSGGVWQNMALLRRSLTLLRRNNFQVYVHRQVPANDGGLALGQAIVAANQLGEHHVPGDTG